MLSFKSYVKTNRDNRRHMRPIARPTPKHPGKFVPDFHKTKVENQKLQKLKQGTSRLERLTHRDIMDLQSTFKFTPTHKHPIKLGNTGISIVFHNNRFFLTKMYGR